MIVSEFCTQALISYSYLISRRGMLANALVPSMLSTRQKNYGGAKEQMRDTVKISKEGYLGTHSPMLGVGDIQSLVFKTDDRGPWYLTADQQHLQQHDRMIGKSKVAEKTKKTLLDKLNHRGVTLQQKRGYTKTELQKLARANSVETHKQVDKILPGSGRQV